MSEISPDTWDWTDVLAGGCSECGYTVGASDFSIAGAPNARVFQIATQAPTMVASGLLVPAKLSSESRPGAVVRVRASTVCPRTCPPATTLDRRRCTPRPESSPARRLRG